MNTQEDLQDQPELFDPPLGPAPDQLDLFEPDQRDENDTRASSQPRPATLDKERYHGVPSRQKARCGMSPNNG